MEWSPTNIIDKNTNLTNNNCPVIDVMLSYIETLRRLGKLKPHK